MEKTCFELRWCYACVSTASLVFQASVSKAVIPEAEITRESRT
ncbi:hypothetical protein Pint_24619 [Pistacia integerrima]|uniref:Uncharacterized protein n=1 Tax=Pistacia integerrima TaxID=434235 RepID=A0ACC0YG30_9ROSI|nr:hypothetical protein Pint_24619 [Pistacia integerrima]